MTGRERIEAAFSPEGAPEFGAVICYEGICIRDHWDELSPYPWWYQYEPSLDRQLAWRSEAISRLGQDWFCLPWTGPRRDRNELTIQAAEGATAVRRNRRTGREEILTRPRVGGWTASGTTESVHRLQLPQTVAEVEQQVPLPRPASPSELLAAGHGDVARALLQGPGQSLYPICHVGSPLWHTYGLWGFEGMMVLTAEAPGLVHCACERYLQQALHSVRLSAALGAAGIWIEECLTDMISPAAFAALNLPYVQRLVEAIRALGLRSIYYFCGNPAGKWPQILATGADAFSFEESKKGFTLDLEDIAERVGGRGVVLGNLDAIGVLQNGSEERLHAEIRRQLDCGRRHGRHFIMSLGSPVTPETRVSRVRLYCDLVRELA